MIDEVRQAEREAFDTGMGDVRDSFRRWNRDPGAVVRVWMGTSALIGVLLLVATWLVSLRVDAGAVVPVASFASDDQLGEALHVLRRNGLVLAMHALICVAGYMALTSMPIVARGYSGWRRRAHLAAGPVAIVFVAVVTVLSFALQAWTLGSAAPGIAEAYGMGVPKLLLLVSIHALPELTAVFLPLGAWLVLVRRGAHVDLLAASVFSTGAAVPLLVIASITEAWITPRVLQLVTG